MCIQTPLVFSVLLLSSVAAAAESGQETAELYRTAFKQLQTQVAGEEVAVDELAATPLDPRVAEVLKAPAGTGSAPARGQVAGGGLG